MANGFAKETRHHFSRRCIAILQAGYDRETGKRAGVKAGAIHALTSDM
jgi:hypothetical protein